METLIYKKGIILLDNKAQLDTASVNILNNINIGVLWNQRGNFGFIKYNPIRFYLNNKPIRGISLFVANFFPFIKIIPYNLSKYDFTINSIQRLTIYY